MRIPGILLKSWKYDRDPGNTMRITIISGIKRKSLESEECYGNLKDPRNTVKILKIQGIQNPPFPPCP